MKNSQDLQGFHQLQLVWGHDVSFSLLYSSLIILAFPIFHPLSLSLSVLFFP